MGRSINKLIRISNEIYLPIVLYEFGIIAFGIEQREGGYEDPKYGQFI